MSKYTTWQVTRHAAQRMLERFLDNTAPTEEQIAEAQGILLSFAHRGVPVGHLKPKRRYERGAAEYDLAASDDNPAMRFRAVKIGKAKVMVTVFKDGF